MRTTITLDPDVAQLVKKMMSERGITFKEAVNGALREAMVSEQTKYEVPARNLGNAKVDLTKALALSGMLEDEAIMDKMDQRK